MINAIFSKRIYVDARLVEMIKFAQEILQPEHIVGVLFGNYSYHFR